MTEESITTSVATLRMALGLSQESLAEKADVSVSVVQKIEQGRIKNVRLDTLTKIAGGLGTTIANLTEPKATDDLIMEQVTQKLKTVPKDKQAAVLEIISKLIDTVK